MARETKDFTTAVELAAAIRARRVSPVEVTRAALDRINRAQPELNAFITIAEESALAQGRTAEAATMRGEAVQREKQRISRLPWNSPRQSVHAASSTAVVK